MKKRKFMIVSQNPYSTSEYVKLGTYNFEIVKDCTYLGTLLTNKNELRPEVEKGITNANRAYYALLPLLVCQSILRAEKMNICKTLITPVATFGAESWILNKGIAKQLATFERTVLNRMSGGMKVNGDWRKQFKKQLMQLFGDYICFHLSE
jgi:hypothetical protein